MISRFFALDGLRQAFPEFADFRIIAENDKGAVFDVLSHNRGFRVALKLTADRSDSGVRDRFEREFQILFSNQQYERLVRIYGDRGCRFVQMANGDRINHYFFTMKLCHSDMGKALQARSLDLCSRVLAVLQMIDGIAFLHAKEIVHRDIKPSNLFIEQVPPEQAECPPHPISVKLGDFDIAKARRGLHQLASQTRTYHLMGTLYYLAPERWQDAPADTDWRPSDQYAAGVTAFQILSNGQFPLNFQGADNYNLDSYQKIHAAGAKLPLVIPERSHKSTPERFLRLERVLYRMLEVAPESRYPNIIKAKLALLDALASSGFWPCRHANTLASPNG